jgi:hypothetical protein
LYYQTADPLFAVFLGVTIMDSYPLFGPPACQYLVPANLCLVCDEFRVFVRGNLLKMLDGCILDCSQSENVV